MVEEIIITLKCHSCNQYAEADASELLVVKQKVKEQIIALEEEFWHIIGEDNNDKAHEIVKAILKELKL